MGNKFGKILYQMKIFSFRNIDLKMSSTKWWSFCQALNMLKHYWVTMYSMFSLFPGWAEAGQQKEESSYTDLALFEWRRVRNSFNLTLSFHCHPCALFNIPLLNPLHAKFFRGNINVYLHFVSFLHIDTMQVFEILPQIRQNPTYST